MRFFNVILILICAANALQAQSVLSSGKWIKLKIEKQGIYRMDAADLAAAGFDLTSVNSNFLQLRGHQCGMLPETNGIHQAGLPEIPMLVMDGNDGKMNNGDYVLFYAGATTKWKYDTSVKAFVHSNNFYSDEGYLYFGVGTTAGKRISTSADVTQAPQNIVSKTYWNYVYEKDLTNPVEMGRTWLGEKLGNEALKRDFKFDFPTDTDDSVYVNVSFAGAMYNESGNLLLNVSGTTIDQTFSPLNTEFETFRLTSKRLWVKSAAKSVNLSLTLTRPNTQSAAWLDFVELNAIRDINPALGPQLLVHRDYALPGVTESRIPLGNYTVWEVTNEMNPQNIGLNNGGSYQYFRSENTNEKTAYFVFTPGNCFKPVVLETLSSSDILAGDPAEFLIISHPNFISAANDLAAFRAAQDGLAVKVVTPESIYKEFSAGQQDIVAIRDYIKAEYQKSIQNGKALKYVLLMGTTSYDPKNRVSGNTNFIPIYHFDSYFKSQSFCLDDFYGYLDSTEGNPAAGTSQMFVAVGRIPCRTLTEANAVVNKIKRYASADALGPWRTDLTFVCDDVDDSWEREFVQESEKYSVKIDNIYSDLRLNKIYADAYKQQSTGNTEKYPEVSNAIDRTMNTGSLFVNYQGHGGEKGWAQEAILTVPMINAWNNPSKMPVLFTATCEFSRFDDPLQQSGGELALLNPSGGAIALMTTTRLVFVSGNSAINNDFWTNYGFPKPNEPIPTLGSIYQRMKNRPGKTSEDNKFALLGDPSMKLAFPEHHIAIDSINGKAALGFADTLKAFEVATFKGHVQKRTGEKFSGFNGTLWVKVYDKPQTRYTLDNDNNNAKLPFSDQSSFIYKGQVTVTDGDFVIVFSIPKDIAYNVATGKMFLYAHNGITDASGAEKLLIGASLQNISPDDLGPQVKLYMNDTTFKNGGQVEADAVFLARVFDESGINATGSGIGRDMLAVLDPNTSAEQQIILNDYFTYDLNSYTRGMVNYDLKGLAPGKHTIKFKVWDIHNNSSEAQISFEVLDANAFKIEENLAAPNPFNENVAFVFVHNLAGSNLQAFTEIFESNGRRVAHFEQRIENATSRETRLKWDGNSESGTPVGPGLYIYKVKLIAEDGREVTFSGRIIKNQ